MNLESMHTFQFMHLIRLFTEHYMSLYMCTCVYVYICANVDENWSNKGDLKEPDRCVILKFIFPFATTKEHIKLKNPYV